MFSLSMINRSSCLLFGPIIVIFDLLSILASNEVLCVMLQLGSEVALCLLSR